MISARVSSPQCHFRSRRGGLPGVIAFFCKGECDVRIGKALGIRRGVEAAAPLLVAMVPIGVVFGAVAIGKGLSPLEASLMSLLVFAGGSQFVAMDLWMHPASWSGLGFAALLVNLRHVLMSASIAGKLDDFTGWRKYAAMLVLTDESWALSEFRVIAGRLTAAFFTGPRYRSISSGTSPLWQARCSALSWVTCR